MTNPNLDRRKVRVNRLKRDGRCKHCGGNVRIYFAVSTCNVCLGEVADAFDDCRRNKPTLVRYYR